MKKILSLFLVVLLNVCVAINANKCYAMERNWQWIKSDDYCGYFIDVENAINHQVSANEVDYSDVWVKVAYTYQGAQNEIDYYKLSGVNPAVLKDGYGLYKLRLKYLTGEVDYLYLGFYDSNGNLLRTQSGSSSTIYSDGDTFLASIMYYMSSKLTGGREFTVNENKGAIRYWKKTDYSGQVTVFLLPRLAIRKDGGKYNYVINTRVLAEDNSTEKEVVQYYSYDGGEEVEVVRFAGYDDDWILHTVDLSNRPKRTEIVPGSYSESISKFVVNYCDDNANVDLINRFGKKGIIVK
ncbi:hypothetical protein [Selenomonas sp. KH1T6]|uniref:hypothetical protein n=1 Tax=Selenomonas sp. KH1T6 TaxID=3158784 RepID=UPI0008A7DB9E|nr:hypothetical protein SAMN05216583_1307 [Selenomonas ruminantium]